MLSDPLAACARSSSLSLAPKVSPCPLFKPSNSISPGVDLKLVKVALEAAFEQKNVEHLEVTLSVSSATTHAVLQPVDLIESYSEFLPAADRKARGNAVITRLIRLCSDRGRVPNRAILRRGWALGSEVSMASHRG